MSFDVIAKQFTDFYYSTFDTNRAQLAALYRDTSMLTYEGTQFQGVNSIVEKLTNLGFQQIRHVITKIDAQPSHPTAGSIMITVFGQLQIDNEQHPFNFMQTFNLYPEGPGQYFVFNDLGGGGTANASSADLSVSLPTEALITRSDEGIKPMSLLGLLILTATLGGIQFAWTVEFAYGTPYLLSLGLTKPLLALVWLAGPLSGSCPLASFAEADGLV
ncbi:Nuclear transport factor 2 [Irineochytrium annulatum]|nr:Nuclear transport factor 2 [Irineochytrium annulatum]